MKPLSVEMALSLGYSEQDTSSVPYLSIELKNIFSVLPPEIILPTKSIILFWAKPVINQPQITKGVASKTIFLLPNHPDNIPPMGEQIIPIIQKEDANNELSLSSNLNSTFVSFFHCGNAIVV